MNGIGGRTIAEAQERMTYSEFVVWMKFRAKRGSLHQGMRVEMALAQLQAFYVNSKTGKDAPRLYQQDFAPHMDPRVGSLEEAVASWA
ncbi:hypothetical protein A7J50_1206 [Pseudomonas antarctica]|uniref:Phage tail protein n=1 Tax=Pseudomonas antarctica TaxID=219572 RepID=A0A172YWI6_9PSED|nr:hypothetical protein [Pseudomonas antarctica]ANF84645.1 hypothetical protein A7J50_1206 [Pseudomonas antarctica]